MRYFQKDGVLLRNNSDDLDLNTYEIYEEDDVWRPYHGTAILMSSEISEEEMLRVKHHRDLMAELERNKKQ